MPIPNFSELERLCDLIWVFYMEKICGIYKITSPSNKIYIGQSIDIYKRWKYHKFSMKKNINTRINNSFKSYGFENHIFEIIEYCLRDDLNRLEKKYVDLYKTYNSIDGLNLKDGGGSKANISDETKIKISKTTKGRIGIKHTEKEKLDQSIRMKGIILNQETKDKMSIAKIGKLKSVETKEKMSKYSKNRSNTHLKNLSESLKGKIKTESHCKNISNSKKGCIAYNKGISKYNFNIEYIITQLKIKSCITISKEYGCNEAVLRNYIKNNTGNTITFYKDGIKNKNRIVLLLKENLKLKD